IGLFKGVVGWLLLGAGIGAFIYGFVPTELLEGLAGADNLWAIPLAAVIGIPMYIRVETMIPIAGILMEKGVSAGVVIALILGGAGCSIPEVSLLNSIFKKPMVVTFVLCILLVAIGTGFAFTLFSLAQPIRERNPVVRHRLQATELRCRRAVTATRSATDGAGYVANGTLHFIKGLMTWKPEAWRSLTAAKTWSRFPSPSISPHIGKVDSQQCHPSR
ncbi:MAG: permease, partial [Adlercreutzia equolifaciens]